MTTMDFKIWVSFINRLFLLDLAWLEDFLSFELDLVGNLRAQTTRRCFDIGNEVFNKDNTRSVNKIVASKILIFLKKCWIHDEFMALFLILVSRNATLIIQVFNNFDLFSCEAEKEMIDRKFLLKLRCLIDS